MNVHRFTLLALLGAFLVPLASAQTVVLRGGAGFLAGEAAEGTNASSVAPNMQVGARLWLTDLFQVQGTFGYNDRLAAEGALYVRPFNDGRKIEPYGFLGYGVGFDDVARITSFPIGVGAQYQTRTDLGFFFELAGRWQSERIAAANLNRLDFYVAPTVGITYAFNPRRPDMYVRANRDEWVPTLRDEPAEPMAAATGRTPEARQQTFTPPSGEWATAPGWETYAQEMSVRPVVSNTVSLGGWGQASSEIEDLGDKVKLPDGTYIMGLTDEDPLLLQTAGLKRVTISAFVIDKHEVSNGEYKAFMNGNPESGSLMPDAGAWERAGSASNMESYFQSNAYNGFPVVAVTWNQANQYCASAGGRLPTEAEWEYAARSGLAGGIYPWPGLEPRNPAGAYMANYNPGRGVYAADGFAFTAPVESFYPSPWGLYHMSGNVAEWVQDSYSASYGALSNFNPTYVDAEEPRRIVRGGSWASDDFYIGVGVRDAQGTDEASIFTGFRCAYGLDVAMGMAESSSGSPSGSSSGEEPSQIAIDIDDNN